MKINVSKITANARGFWALVCRECSRFMRLFIQTIAPPVITTLLFILIFGYSLGDRIHEIGGFRYILYILPGLAAMGVITNAFANSSTSLFMARMDFSIEGLLVAPLSYLQIVASYVIGGIMRGVVVGGITLLVSLVMTDLSLYSLIGTLTALLMISLLFSCLGILAALWAEEWDHIATFTNFVITPFVYLGGVFYAIEMLPPFWQKVSYFNPIFYMVDYFRSQVLGISEINPLVSLSLILGLSLASFLLCVHLFQRGWKLIH